MDDRSCVDGGRRQGQSGIYPIDIERAFKSLDRIKPHVKTWWKDNSQAQALMEQQEVDLMAVMDGRASETIATNSAPYQVVWNEQISTGSGQGWIVLGRLAQSRQAR